MIQRCKAKEERRDLKKISKFKKEIISNWTRLIFFPQLTEIKLKSFNCREIKYLPWLKYVARFQCASTILWSTIRVTSISVQFYYQKLTGAKSNEWIFICCQKFFLLKNHHKGKEAFQKLIKICDNYFTIAKYTLIEPLKFSRINLDIKLIRKFTPTPLMKYLMLNNLMPCAPNMRMFKSSVYLKGFQIKWTENWKFWNRLILVKMDFRIVRKEYHNCK